MQPVSSHEDGMDRTTLGVWYTHFVAHDTTDYQSRAFWQCYGHVWLNIPSGPKRRTGTWEGSESLTVDKNMSDKHHGQERS